MITVRLVGATACRRYQRMAKVVKEQAHLLGIPISMEENTEPASLAQYNPLSLPRMYIEDELIASKNPPKPEVVAMALGRKARER